MPSEQSIINAPEGTTIVCVKRPQLNSNILEGDVAIIKMHPLTIGNFAFDRILRIRGKRTTYRLLPEHIEKGCYRIVSLRDITKNVFRAKRIRKEV
jgi:hypothetical protein